jgi:DNA-binding transcriptional ArsR family regulator
MEKNTCIRQEADENQIFRCKDELLSLDQNLNFLSEGLELLGNKVRLKILFLIRKETRLCVCDLSDILGMTLPAISQHLRKLKDRKFLKSEKEAQTIYYLLTSNYSDLLEPILNLVEPIDKEG